MMEGIKRSIIQVHIRDNMVLAHLEPRDLHKIPLIPILLSEQNKINRGIIIIRLN